MKISKFSVFQNICKVTMEVKVNRFREINKTKMIRSSSYNPKYHSKVERSHRVPCRKIYYDLVQQKKTGINWVKNPLNCLRRGRISKKMKKCVGNLHSKDVLGKRQMNFWAKDRIVMVQLIFRNILDHLQKAINITTIRPKV